MKSETEHIEYIQRGYDNMQACVSKLDTKATIINTANALLVAYTVHFGKWWLSSHEFNLGWSSISIVGYLLNLVILGVALFLALRVFYKTSKVWFPNHSLLNKENFSAMFPEWDNKKLDRAFVQSYYVKLKQNPDSIQKDQQEQCIVMGNIIYNKIENLQVAKKSIIWLSFMLLLVTISPVIETLYISFLN